VGIAPCVGVCGGQAEQFRNPPRHEGVSKEAERDVRLLYLRHDSIAYPRGPARG
jgi:hypothetical protein